MTLQTGATRCHKLVSARVWMIAAALFASSALAQVQTEDLRIVRTSEGRATFVTHADGGVIPVTIPAPRARVTAEDFLQQYGHLFGADNPENQLVLQKKTTGALGQVHSTFRQVHHGIPVFSGLLKVHQNAQGEVVAANGDFYALADKLRLTPTITAKTAVDLAIDRMPLMQGEIEEQELVIVDPGWYGDLPRGERLAYRMILRDMSAPAREAFFVDAHTGEILDQWTLLHTARVRAIYDGLEGGSLPGFLVREETDGPTGDFDTDAAYDYAGDVYDFFSNGYGRDSIDDAGMTLVLTVHSQVPPCPNAFWGGTQMVFCTGTVTDDVTAHEIGHGVTERTANLIYQNQSGQLNESYSDVFGELIDLYNGDAAFPGAPGGTPWPTHPTGPGLDTPNNLRTACSPNSSYPDGVRWLIGEDATAFGGAIRDMWDPPCKGDPDRANSPLQTCSSGDSGGVHSGSGIPNHAFAMLTDGKSFNGFTVSAIGPIKAGAVWYRALTTYLTPASDFANAYVALNQAATDLIGSTPLDPRTGGPSSSSFTADDAAEVDKALLAVEMNTDGACGKTIDVLDPTPPDQCEQRATFFYDDFESGAGLWTVSNTGPPTPYDWIQTTSVPIGRSGTAWYCADPSIGNCGGAGDESAVHYLFSPLITLPAQVGDVTLAFTHYLATESGWDGGNLKARVNGGSWELVPRDAFAYNPYNTDINPAELGNTNPLEGEPGWTGGGGQWGTSIVDLADLAGAGDTIELRFDFGKDGCAGNDGWYLLEIEVYSCACDIADDCEDGLFCTGEPSCISGFCGLSGDPCDTGLCDEDNDRCLQTVFADNFEANKGWTTEVLGAGSGQWQRGVPVNDNGWDYDPVSDSDGSGSCHLTHNVLGNTDVDDGAVRLISPAIDMSAGGGAIGYDYFLRLTNTSGADRLLVEINSTDGSGLWIEIARHDTDGGLSWRSHTVTPEEMAAAGVTFTPFMKVRFTANDADPQSIVESAVDAFVAAVTVTECGIDADCNDSDICTQDLCNPGDPAADDFGCVFTEDSSVCEDNNPCTVDTCETGSGCVHTDNNDECDDGEACTEDDVCQTGDCVGTPVTILYGDVNGDGFADIDDTLITLACFGGECGDCIGGSSERCDIYPCGGGDSFVDIDDSLATLAAFSGEAECPDPCP